MHPYHRRCIKPALFYFGKCSFISEKDDQTSVKAVMKGAGDNPPKVSIKSFEGTIRLN
jgi:hypothetical protein